MHARFLEDLDDETIMHDRRGVFLRRSHWVN